MINVLISSRKNSKFLGKFLANLKVMTHSRHEMRVGIMLDKEDTWNEDIVEAFKDSFLHVFALRDDNGYGRQGLHSYFNQLAFSMPKADWTVYFCDDHSIIANSWDAVVTTFAQMNNLDPEKCYAIIPKFDNVGTMNHILSKGMIQAMGAIGKHGWIDSYLNEVFDHVRPKDRIAKMDIEIFHDFTHDKPYPMSEEHCKRSKMSDLQFLKFDDEINKQQIDKDANKINEAIQNES